MFKKLNFRRRKWVSSQNLFKSSYWENTKMPINFLPVLWPRNRIIMRELYLISDILKSNFLFYSLLFPKKSTQFFNSKLREGSSAIVLWILMQGFELRAQPFGIRSTSFSTKLNWFCVGDVENVGSRDRNILYVYLLLKPRKQLVRLIQYDSIRILGYWDLNFK